MLAPADRITHRIIETGETSALLPAFRAAEERELRTMIDRRVAWVLEAIAVGEPAKRCVVDPTCRVPLGQFNPPRFASMMLTTWPGRRRGSMSLARFVGVLTVAALVERVAAEVVPSRGHREVAAERGESR